MAKGKPFSNLINDLKSSPKSLIVLKSRLDQLFSPDIERTLTIIKPDAVKKGLIGEVIKRLEVHGIEPVGMKMVKLTAYQAELFYSHLRGSIPESVFGSLVQYMTSNKVVLIVWQGSNVVSEVRKLTGPTNPKEAKRGQIRKLSDDDMQKKRRQGRAVKNIIHSSASLEEARQEISFFFLPWEIVS